MLTLRNGHVLQGRITSVGDYYLVTLGDQGEARVPAASVEMVCDTLEIAYFRKRDAVRDGDLNGHLELAEWCLRNQLPVRAADQLLAAFALVPESPRIGQLETRLAMQMSALASEEGDATAASAPPAELAMTMTPSQLSEHAVLQFTQKVQPTLVNRCASNACHGTRSRQQFQVMRPARGQPVPYRMTVRNLQSALAFVDHEQPARSPLVAAPRVAHGGLAVPVFGQREALQYEQLLAWVQMVARQSTSAAAQRPGRGARHTTPGDLAGWLRRAPAGGSGRRRWPEGDNSPSGPPDPAAPAPETPSPNRPRPAIRLTRTYSTGSSWTRRERDSRFGVLLQGSVSQNR